MTRRGLSFVEALLAAVVVFTLAGMAAVGVWQWSRGGRVVERHQRALAIAAGRLEMVAALPLHRRPGPGTYAAADASGDPDLARALAPAAEAGETLEFTLEVEEVPVEYPDYFFGGGAVKHIDFRRFRLSARGPESEL